VVFFAEGREGVKRAEKISRSLGYHRGVECLVVFYGHGGSLVSRIPVYYSEKPYMRGYAMFSGLKLSSGSLVVLVDSDSRCATPDAVEGVIESVLRGDAVLYMYGPRYSPKLLEAYSKRLNSAAPYLPNAAYMRYPFYTVLAGPRHILEPKRKPRWALEHTASLKAFIKFGDHALRVDNMCTDSGAAFGGFEEVVSRGLIEDVVLEAYEAGFLDKLKAEEILGALRV